MCMYINIWIRTSISLHMTYTHTYIYIHIHILYMYNQKSICQQQGARKATTSGYAARQPLNVSQHFYCGPKT